MSFPHYLLISQIGRIGLETYSIIIFVVIVIKICMNHAEYLWEEGSLSLSEHRP